MNENNNVLERGYDYTWTVADQVAQEQEQEYWDWLYDQEHDAEQKTA